MVPNRTPESPLRRLRNRARNRAMAQLLHFESVRSAYVGRGASCPLPQSSNSWVCPSSLPSRSRVRGLASSTRPATKGWATTATAARTISLPKCLRILRCSEHTRTDDGRARAPGLGLSRSERKGKPARWPRTVITCISRTRYIHVVVCIVSCRVVVVTVAVMLRAPSLGRTCGRRKD